MSKSVWTMLLVLGLSGRLMAQTNVWDSVLANTQWYVPVANLSAYLAPGTNLADPQLIADQTIWTLGACVDGVFTGTSDATFKLGPVESSSVTTMNGLVVGASGQIRIVFSDNTNPPTIGIGQIREVDNATYVEMQMISGSPDAVFITHWAYMAAYDGDQDSLPPLVPNGGLLSPEWNWMEGTSWNLECADLFGAGEVGLFTIGKYVNGYFWGKGSGPLGSEAASFTLIGSATPEGNVLLNILSGDTLTSLTGLIAGDASTGTMGLRAYEAGEIGSVALAQVVPEPGAMGLLVLGGAMLVWGSAVFRRGLPLRGVPTRQAFSESKSKFNPPPKLISHNIPDKDIYRFFVQGSTGFVPVSSCVSYAEEKAEKFCERQGKGMLLLGQSTSNPIPYPGNFPKAEIVFACIDKK